MILRRKTDIIKLYVIYENMRHVQCMSYFNSVCGIYNYTSCTNKMDCFHTLMAIKRKQSVQSDLAAGKRGNGSVRIQAAIDTRQ